MKQIPLLLAKCDRKGKLTLRKVYLMRIVNVFGKVF